MTDETIFNAALEKADPTERVAFLTEVCGDDTERRRRLDGLLAAHAGAVSFLERPAAAAHDPHAGDSRTVGQEGGAPADGDEVPLAFLGPTTRSDSLGRIEHYEVLQVLGKGGFGIVFRAFDDVLHRVVAVKVLSPQLAATSPARKRFLREARSSAQVRHENVVQVYEVGEQPLPHLVMEFIPGETLQQRLDRTGPLDVPEVLWIGRQIAEGLAAAHACDLIHRDIKPGNILLEGGSHKVKITDFGLARAADDASISQSGIIAGTPMFMAPEQALGHHIDQRADLFSLGSVLYQLASGRPPFRAPSALAVLKRVAEERPRPIPEIIPETPDWLCGIIAKLHAKNPADRFQSAREVADLLADCEAKLKAKQRVKNVLPAARKPAARKWLVAAVVVLLPVIALAVTEFAGVTQLFSRHATPDPIKPDVDPPSGLVAKKESPVPVEKKETPVAVEKKETPVPVAPARTVLKPVEMKSEGGATLTLQEDGSILVSGAHPAKDSYTLTFRNHPAKIQALRLEVLPHSSLPNNGPGRDASGEFVLTTIKARLEVPKNPDAPRVLKLVKAWADNNTGVDSEERLAIDEDDNTGWKTEVGKPHFAVFELAEPVMATEGMVLRVTLEFKWDGEQHQLGCFRLSAAADANAFK